LIEYREENGALTFLVKVVPRSSKSSLVGEHGGSLRVRLKSPPVEGAANEELVELLAATFSISRQSVEILKGHSSRTKRVRLEGVTAKELLALLG
jgi:uncharacterized protein